MTLLVIALLLRFIVFGKTQVATDPQALDTRISVMMTAEERVYVLHEMRGMLEGVQDIVAALRIDDMEKISTVARSLGRNVADDAPAGLMGKLPLEFKTLGLGTHASFDQISVTARDPKNKDLVFLQLANVLNNCVACHATYQIKTEKQGKLMSLNGKNNESLPWLASLFVNSDHPFMWKEDHTKALVQHLSNETNSIGYP